MGILMQQAWFNNETQLIRVQEWYRHSREDQSLSQMERTCSSIQVSEIDRAV